MSVEISSGAPSSYYLEKPLAKLSGRGKQPFSNRFDGDFREKTAKFEAKSFNSRLIEDEKNRKNGGFDEDLKKVSGILSSCGKWASKGACENGHRHSRTIDCGRPWCVIDDCRERSHMRRVSRWLPKAFKMGWMGYWVVTFPLDMREEMKHGLKKNLTEIRNTVEAVLRSLGFDVGLYAWHYYSEKQPGVWNPHFNIFTESGYLADDVLELVQDLIREALGLPENGVINYGYTKSIKTKLKNLRYVCRPTFLDRSWDYGLADQLFNFKNLGSWGSKKCLTGEWGVNKKGKKFQRFKMEWPGEDKWILPRREKLLGYHMQVVNSICPLCGEKIIWGGVVPTEDLIDQGFEQIWSGIYTERPPPGDLSADKKFCGQLKKYKLFRSLKVGRVQG
ncbi:hypothetical protein ES705_28986 [subsurface metagenome]